MKNRLKEPSTWAAIGIIFQITKALAPPAWHGIIDGVSGLAAIYAGVTPEGDAQ